MQLKHEFKKDVKFISYKDIKIPEGRKITAVFTDSFIIVYQAFREETAKFAVKNQKFGGEFYSNSRMTWIKTNFLWMMYRCGWCQKDKNQKRVLAIYLPVDFFVNGLLKNSVLSFYPKDPKDQKRVGKKKEKTKKKKNKIVLQWDPHHSPNGEKVKMRRAIQIGMKGSFANEFRKNILKIEDITDFVVEQFENISDKEKLKVPLETEMKISDDKLRDQILLD